MFNYPRYGYAVLAAILLGGLIMYTHHSKTAPSSDLIDAQGKPTPAFLTLFKNVEGIDAHNYSVQQLVDYTQKEWLRKPGTERWQMEEKIVNNRDAIIQSLNALGLLATRKPTKKEYDYCIVFGSAAKSMRKRIAYTLNLYTQGIQCKHYIFLGGKRPLDPQQENKEMLLDRANKELPIRTSWQLQELPTNETELIKFLIDQAEIPAGLNGTHFVFVDAPMKIKADGSTARPTTGDTIHHWLATNPTPGSCLFISSQPYVGYQDAVARTFMPDTFDIETVGVAAEENEPIAVLLDTVARWLYQENMRLQEKAK